MNSFPTNRILRALTPLASRARSVTALAVAAIAISSCGKASTEPVTSTALATITVTPNATLSTSGTVQMVAVGTDANGAAVAITPTWTVTAGGGTISTTGMFTGGTTAGTNTVVATVGTITGRATITVTATAAGPLATITVSPNPASVAAGATQQFTAVAKDAAGITLSVTPTWSVAAVGGGTITSTGLYTAGVTAGTFTNLVVATSGTVTGTATVTVTGTVGALATITVGPAPIIMPQNGTQLFTAVGRDGAGNVVPITPAWTVVNGGGTISTGGRFTAGAAPGVFTGTVSVTAGAIQGVVTVSVTGPIAAVSVTPGQASIAAGTARQFTAVATDALGTPVAGTAAWTLVSGGGTLDATGLFTAGIAGGTFTSTVRASIGGVTGSASVTVATTSGVVASITVAPSPTTISAGGSRKFIATGFDASGISITITPTWSVVGGGGTINTLGYYTSGSVAGTFANSVTATSGAASGTATVIIEPPSPPGQLALIQVLPVTADIPVNGSAQYTATGFDAHDNVVAITPVWTVVNGGGTVSSTGLFTAGGVVGNFIGTVRATNGNFFGIAAANVTATAAADRRAP
jgi:hypothetical protein